MIKDIGSLTPIISICGHFKMDHWRDKIQKYQTEFGFLSRVCSRERINILSRDIVSLNQEISYITLSYQYGNIGRKQYDSKINELIDIKSQLKRMIGTYSYIG